MGPLAAQLPPSIFVPTIASSRGLFLPEYLAAQGTAAAAAAAAPVEANEYGEARGALAGFAGGGWPLGP